MADLYVWLTRQINHPVATDCRVRCAHCYWCQTLATILSLPCQTLATVCLIATVPYFGHCRSHRCVLYFGYCLSHRYGTILRPLSISSLRAIFWPLSISSLRATLWPLSISSLRAILWPLSISSLRAILWPLSISSLRYHTLATISHRYDTRLWPLYLIAMIPDFDLCFS